MRVYSFGNTLFRPTTNQKKTKPIKTHTARGQRQTAKLRCSLAVATGAGRPDATADG